MATSEDRRPIHEEIKRLRLETHTGPMEISNVDEFVTGDKYFYVARTDGSTPITIIRGMITNVLLQKDNGPWRKVCLPKVRRRNNA